MLKVKYPNSHGLDGAVHTMEINEAYSLNDSDDSVLLICDEKGKEVTLHLVKKEEKWKMVPHTNEEYVELNFLVSENITSSIKPELDGLKITNVEEEEKKKGKNIVNITSLAAAAILGFLAARGFDLTKKSNPSSITRQNKTTVTSTILPRVTPTLPKATPTLPRVTPTTAPIPTKEVVQGDRFSIIIKKLYNDEKVSEDDIMFVMDEIHTQSYENIPGVRNLLDGKRMTGSKKEVKFYELAPDYSVDRAVLSTYCYLRNNLINNAHLQDDIGTRNDVKFYLNKSGDFIFDGSKFEYANVDYNFYDLEPITRYIIVDLGMQMLLADPTYTEIINGRVCNNDQVMNEYVETYSTVSERLVNNSVRRK